MPARPQLGRLILPQVTLCAATSVNIKATVSALVSSLEQVDFAECKLFTNEDVQLKHPKITVIPIPRINSSSDYSRFVLTKMVEHIETSHCLVTQWDGHVIDARRWLPAFLDYDYIGASWPQFKDGHNVGNGGFSLRSRKLMEACRDTAFQFIHPEDVAIGRLNRQWLEDKGMRFAPQELADTFSAERASSVDCSFGYHGVFNMPRAIGVEAFWRIYRELTDRSSADVDFRDILKSVWLGPGGMKRAAWMVGDHIRRWLQ